MLRIITVTVFVATLGVTAILYKLKYDTRSLQLEAVELRRQIEAERAQLAVLKAEWSVLTQPQRIDRLAGEMGLKPLDPKQIINFSDLKSLPYRAGKPVAKATEPKPKADELVRKISFTPRGSVDGKQIFGGFELRQGAGDE